MDQRLSSCFTAFPDPCFWENTPFFTLTFYVGFTSYKPSKKSQPNVSTYYKQ